MCTVFGLGTTLTKRRTRNEAPLRLPVHHATKIDTIARALYALDRRLNISVSAT